MKVIESMQTIEKEFIGYAMDDTVCTGDIVCDSNFFC